MKSATIALCCIFLTGTAWPETVTVNVSPERVQLTSSHSRIAVVLDGKPIRGVRIDLYKWNVSPRLCFSGLTNRKGISTLPTLAAGDYYVDATLGDLRNFLRLRVIDAGITTLSIIDLTHQISGAVVSGGSHVQFTLPDAAVPSTSRSQVAVMLDGKPLKGAKVDFYKWILNKDSGALWFSGLTDNNGVATPPALTAGDYHVVATPAGDHVVATLGEVSSFLWLRVIDLRTAMTTLSMVDLTESVHQAQRIQDDAIRLAAGQPIRDRVQTFQGRVVDQSGAVIANAKIQIIKNGPEERAFVVELRTDSAGFFSAQLADGLYLGIFYSQGFGVEPVPFEVTKGGSGDLKVVLNVDPHNVPILTDAGAHLLRSPAN